ncbi:uncharacterized protein LOC105841943 [Bombyx mori]|uniref:Uncharacterized protein n=1 Tax=Bombyx mori TaxID=7091 RepID=A0A8R2M4D1_BOMMO|nr:uncharacterized protein LOC105841943 [Bombyx mori]
MQRSYIALEIKTRLITNKEQFLGPLLNVEQPPAEPSWHKDYEPLDTTHEGFEKYLDPYLTSSRLHHRPFTVEQLNKKSSSSDIITYYTCADIPWTRTPAPKTEQWKPPNRPKSTYDREKFKEGFREIRTHNKLKWVPGTFRTEMRDNYSKNSYLDPIVHSNEEEVRSFYENTLSKLRTNITEEHSAYFKKYKSENTQYGLRKPICSVLDQHKEKNKKLE